MTNQAYENLKRSAAVTPDLNQMQLQTMQHLQKANQTLTEQKKQGLQFQGGLQYDESITNRTGGTTMKPPSSKRTHTEEIQVPTFESQV